MDEIEDIKRRLLQLESISSDKVEKVTEEKDKKQHPYQAYMSKRILELKSDAERYNIPFDRKQAFGQAAKEWSAKKRNN